MTGLLTATPAAAGEAGVDALRRAVVVEDDGAQADLVATILEQAGFRVTAVASGEEAVLLVAATQPDLVTLDLGLPGMDGVEVCRRIRRFTSCYVVVISADLDEGRMLLSLESGADEYLAKPLSPRELRARVAAVLRRPRAIRVAAPVTALPESAGRETPDDPVPVTDAIVVDVAARTVEHAGVEVALTATELAILAHLLGRSGAVCGRSELLELVRSGAEADGRVLNVHVSHLRAKLGRLGAAGLVRTVRGVGYRVDGSPAVRVRSA